MIQPTKFRTLILLAMLGTTVGLTACDKKGPAEQAGEKVDQATENAGEAVNKAVDKAGDALEKAGDAAKQATDN